MITADAARRNSNEGRRIMIDNTIRNSPEYYSARFDKLFDNEIAELTENGFKIEKLRDSKTERHYYLVTW